VVESKVDARLARDHNQRLMKEIHKAFDKHLYLPNWWLIDVVCAWYVGSHLEDGKPIWMALVGPPSSGKTVMLDSLEGLLRVHPMGGFSENAFISGMNSRRRGGGETPRGVLEKIADERDYDEGIFVSYGTKFLTFPDFTAIFGVRPEVRHKVLGQLRMLYDQNVAPIAYGNGKSVSFQGRVGALAASTPAWDKFMGPETEMGERFVLWRIGRINSQKTAVIALGQDKKKMRAELQETMKHLEKMKLSPYPDVTPLIRWVVELADKTAIARTVIKFDPYHREPEDSARPEAAPRLAEQLMQLAKGLMLVKGLEDVDDREIKTPLERIAISSLPIGRFDVLANIPDEGCDVPHLVETLKMPTSTVKRQLLCLIMLDIVVKVHATLYVVNENWTHYHALVKKVWNALKKEGE
jgi:hypothetical protein